MVPVHTKYCNVFILVFIHQTQLTIRAQIRMVFHMLVWAEAEGCYILIHPHPSLSSWVPPCQWGFFSWLGTQWVLPSLF